jgi:hypothetical protein
MPTPTKTKVLRAKAFGLALESIEGRFGTSSAFPTGEELVPTESLL